MINSLRIRRAVGGGDDIGPELYGLPVPEDKRYDRERDQLDHYLKGLRIAGVPETAG